MWIDIRKSQATTSRNIVRMQTRPQIERAIAMRRYAWGKPLQQIADEAGVNIQTINKVLRKQEVSTESYALLTSYLKTPTGPASLINNRAGKASEKSARRPLMRRIMSLTSMAIRYDIKCSSKITLMSRTQGELRAYFYRLDFRVKEAIMNDPKWPDSIRGKFVIPDCLEAWQWVERLDLLREHLRTSSIGSGERSQTIGSRRPYTDRMGPFPSQLRPAS